MTRIRKLIALSQRVEISPAYGERRDALDQRWTAFLSACGYDALPMPNAGAAIGSWLEAIVPDGLIFTGGNDLAALGGAAPERDATEESALAWAVSHDLPVVGICRGMQFLAHRSGGILKQIEGHAGTRHPVSGDVPDRIVNSYHRWAVTEVGEPWRILARALDGSIEAIKRDDRAHLGLMWHPERESPFLAADMEVMRHHLGANT